MRCGACRFDNPPGFKFCGECGARLTTADGGPPIAGTADDGSGVQAFGRSGVQREPDLLPPERPNARTPERLNAPTPVLSDRTVSSGVEPAGERRKVTILFADLKDNTRLAERLEVEDVYHLLHDCLRGLADVIFKHEGYVDKFMGDGIMALFGAPVAHGDDPQRALRAALEMQEWVREYGRGIEARWGAPLRMRIGLNYGTVIAGRVGTDLKMEYDVIGDAVNVAKRMEEVAEPDTVCVSEPLFRLTERWFEFVPRGALAVKGKRQPQAVYRLVGPRAGAAAVDDAAAEGPIVGRARELERLMECLRRARDGEPQLVFVSGEPGIGKTRLLEEWLRRASQEKGAAPLRLQSDRCYERQAHTPYDLCRRLVQAVGGLSLISEEDEPFLRQMLSPDEPRPELRWLDQQARKQLTVAALCRLLLRWTGEAPTVLLLDDLQWIDALSLEVLDALVERLPEEAERQGCLPLLLAVAYRPEFAHAWPPLPAPAHLALDVLDRGSCLKLIASRLAPLSLPEDLLQSILERTGGNPFYLEEIVRSLAETALGARRSALSPTEAPLGHLVERNPLSLEPGAWSLEPERSDLPDSLYGAIMARLDRLRGEERAVIQSAAVVGTVFPARIVAELSTIQQDVSPLLNRLEALEFLREVSPPPRGEYAFKHSAVREVAYNTLLLDQRRLSHRRVAGLLAELHRGREAEHLESLAHHCLLGELWSRAVAYLLLAGDQARELYANADAIDFYERALALLKRVEEESPGAEELLPMEQSPSQSRPEPALREGVADVRFRLGEYEAAWQEYERALALASEDAVASCDRPGSTLRVASLLRRMAKCRAEMGEHEQALALLADADVALEECEEDPAVVEQSRIARECGWAYYATGRHSEAIRCAEQVLALAERCGAAPERSDGYNLLGLVAKATGQYEEAIGHYSRTLELARCAGDLLGVGVALNNLGTVFSDQGRLVEAEKRYEEAARIWDRMGDVIQKAQTLNNLGNLSLARGAFAEAESRFGAAHQLFTRARHPMGTAVSLATLGETCLEAGRLAEAASSLEAALQLAESIPVPELISHVRAVLAQAYLESGRVDLAEQACAAALRDSEHPDETLYAAIHGRLRRVSGMVSRARGDRPAALAELERARQILSAAGLPQELGRTCVELARLRREWGDEAEAAALLEEALRLFTRAGAQADLKRAQAIASSRS